MNYFFSNIKYLLDNNRFENFQISAERLYKLVLGNKRTSLNTAVKISEFTQIKIDDLIYKDLAKIEKIKENFDLKFLVCDIDGVLTDGGMYYSQSGDEMKKFNTKDGIAIKNVIKNGIKVGFLSSGINANIIENRAKLLEVEYVYVGTWKKLEILQKWCEELNINLKNVAYVGDDINDIDVIKNVGLSACPSDAIDSVKKETDIILSKKGGDACLREFVDEWLFKQ